MLPEHQCFRKSVDYTVEYPRVTELSMPQAHRRLQGHQLITHHQPASPQEKDNPKNVDHAGREHTIPGPEQHWFPYEQLDLPPGLGLGQSLLKTGHTGVSSAAVGRAGVGRERRWVLGELSFKALLLGHALQACAHSNSCAVCSADKLFSKLGALSFRPLGRLHFPVSLQAVWPRD